LCRLRQPAKPVGLSFHPVHQHLGRALDRTGLNFDPKDRDHRVTAGQLSREAGVRRWNDTAEGRLDEREATHQLGMMQHREQCYAGTIGMSDQMDGPVERPQELIQVGALLLEAVVDGIGRGRIGPVEAATHRDHTIPATQHAADLLPLSVVAERSVDQDDVRAAATDPDRQALWHSDQVVRRLPRDAAGCGNQATGYGGDQESERTCRSIHTGAGQGLVAA
jgi:hypothetical protein